MLRSDDLLGAIGTRTRDVLAHQLLARGPDMITLLKENWNQPPRWLGDTVRFLRKYSGLNLLTPLHWLILLLSVTFALVIGWLLRRGLEHWAGQKTWHADEFSSRFLHALVVTVAHYAPHLLGSSAAAVLFYVVTMQMKPIPFITVIAVSPWGCRPFSCS